MKYFFIPFWLIMLCACWPLFRVACLFGKHSGLEIKHSHFENGVEVVTKHEVHCSVCNKVEIKV